MVKHDCPDCGQPMDFIRRERELIEPDFDEITDGQMADYFGELESGMGSNWSVMIEVWACHPCKKMIGYTD